MNNARRKLIAKAIQLIEEACNDETEARDNLPEGIAESERGEQMDTNINSLDDAMAELREIDGMDLYE